MLYDVYVICYECIFIFVWCNNIYIQFLVFIDLNIEKYLENMSKIEL